MLLFGRVVELIIGEQGETGIGFDGFRVAFDIKKTLPSTKNTMQLSIYNLNETSRNKLDKKDLTVILKAGYDGMTELIFKGDVTLSTHVRTGNDIISKLNVVDGNVVLRDTKISESFGPGITVKQIFTTLADALGVPIKEIPAQISGQNANGFSMSGRVKDVIDSLSKSFGFDWSIQDGELQVTDQDSTTRDREVLLTPDTGLLGIPEKWVSDDSKLSDDDTAKILGVKVKSLLNPKLRAGGAVRVTSRFISGDYKIINVNHIGDTHENNWFSTIEAEFLKV